VIVYLDASALVKRYLAEQGSTEVNKIVTDATAIGTSLVSLVEVVAAIGRAVGMGGVLPAAGERAMRLARSEFGGLVALPVTAGLVARAADLAWEHGLRGYDAVHLGSALSWQEDLAEPVVVATFDRELWQTARQLGMQAWPP
jgi:predicted nucleic acid-binding protein